MFSSLKKRILRKEEEESPLERAKRDVEEHYKPISPEDTFKDLNYYVSDVIAPEWLEKKYEMGRILNEPRFIDFTSKVGGLQGSCRFLILSNHMIPSSDPDYEGLDVYMNKPNSKFKVVDFYRSQGITQIALLHLPDEGWESFKRRKVYEDIMSDVRDLLLDCLKMDVIPELDCEKWKKREHLPVGITFEGDYFELDALNNYGYSENASDSLSDVDEINYGFDRLDELMEVHIRSFCISNLLNRYDMEYSKEGEVIKNKLWTDIKNGLPLVKVNERFVEYFKEEFRKKHPNREMNFNDLKLFVKTDNDSKKRLNEMEDTFHLFYKFVYNGKGISGEYINLLSSKHLSYIDTFLFRQLLYDKIKNEEINSQNFNEEVDKACDEYYDKFIYNRNNYPKTLEKAIAFLIRDLDEDQIEEIKNSDKLKFSISSHFFLGMYIRNQYGIFNMKNMELLSDCKKKTNQPLIWADNYSGFILDELWEEINKNYPKIILSKNMPDSFYYKKVEDDKVPAPPWLRYPHSKLSDFLDEDYFDEIEICKGNNINVPSFLLTEIDDKKPAQYLRLKEEVEVIAEHTIGCLPFTYNGEPKYHIAALKEEFRPFWQFDNEDFCPHVNDTILKCSNHDPFIYDGKTLFTVYNFIDLNRAYLFSEIDDAVNEIKNRNKFKFFNTKISNDEDLEEIKGIYQVGETSSLFVIDDNEMEERIRKEKLWSAMVKKYSKEEIWEKIKYTVALNGIYVKAMQNKDFRDELLNTGNKFLLNLNINDTSWGLYRDDKKLIGKNLYGLALMEARDEIKRLYENEDKIDWEYYKTDYNKDYDLSYAGE